MTCEIEVFNTAEHLPDLGEWVIGYDTTYRTGWRFVRLCVGTKGGSFWAYAHGSMTKEKITHWFRPPVLR